LQLPAPFTALIESQLAQALSNTRIACVLLASGEKPLDEIQADRLIDLVQATGAACLIDDDVLLAERVGADGVHIDADAQVYTQARERLGKEANIGASCAFSRHDAIRLAEMGADYVAFGTTVPSGIETIDQCSDLISWWAEMFVVPCVAWNIDKPDDAARLARLGADFVAPSRKIWLDGNPTSLIAEIGRAIAEERRAA
jgi:thiamine-phosphate pyrophosphorylase